MDTFFLFQRITEENLETEIKANQDDYMGHFWEYLYKKSPHSFVLIRGLFNLSIRFEATAENLVRGENPVFRLEKF